uniref:Uncharacterized protein n=1 Tax=Plectus sambesii TaxID=2011161 RepID=A0A914X5Y8_9BILA
MLGGFDSTVGVGQGERQPIKQVVALPQQKSVPLPQLDSKLPDNGVKNLLNALTSPAPQRYTKLTSSDQQIVDLAKLVTAKDAIVEQQRTELKATENDLASTSAKLKDRESELTQERARIEAQNHELEILRALAKEQTYLCSQVQTLTKENQSLSKDLVDKDKQIEHDNEIKENLEKALRVMKDEKAALENEVHSLRGQLELSTHRLSELELLAEAVGVDDGQAVKTYAQLQNDFASSNSQLEELTVVKANLDKDLSESQSKIEELNQLSASLAAENSALSQKSSELESKCASIERHLTTLEQKWTTKITERTDHLTTDKQALEEEVNDLRSRQSELTALTDRLASEALRASERAKQTELEKDELKKQLEAVDNVWQEKLAAEKNYCKEETDYLRSDLSESQKRVAELTTLIDRFATDARNHERLVIDML